MMMRRRKKKKKRRRKGRRNNVMMTMLGVMRMTRTRKRMAEGGRRKGRGWMKEHGGSGG